ATGAALLVIFDADQVAEPEFLLKTVPPFADTSIGWVQTGQYYGNLENPVARWAHDQQALFYRVLCPGKAAQNAAFICGTNVVLRAAALDEIGGLPQSSVTEDFMASIELHPRWRSMFVREQLATGLGPMDLHSYFNQQRRWAIGTLSVLRSHWRQIFLPWVGGLSPAQRLQYALACTHYLCGVRDLVYLVAPLVFIFVGVPAVQGATLGDFFWHFLPYWLMAQVAFWWVVWGRSSMRGIVIGFGSFPVLVGSLFTVLTGRRVGFSVTAKQRGNSNSLGQLWPHMLGLAACLVGIGYAFWLGISSGPMLVSVIWVAYTAALLGGVLWLGAADAGLLRGAARPRPTGAPVRPFRLKRLPLALGGGVVATTLIACLAAPAMLHTPAQPFTLAVDGGRPRLGLALPQELVQSRPAELEQQLGQQFAVVGRTQTIGDHFDQPWASQLQASGGRPWLTLLFGSPADDPINASLPAIANGLHDEALRRWANDIRTYGGPVYLSILPHVDRNWSLSSAVANGGIPQDAPRAWSHVRQIFAEAGANNVAWVWAAADPANDARYAPAADQIDAVLLSLISFPDTDWADPTTALRAAVERYPSKPLFVEVSAAGEAERKANWLREVGAAIATTPNVYAFLYHEGGPTNQNGTLNADQQAWSLASSPQVLAAMRDAINQAGVGQQAQPAGANQ
ncbi:MAG: glycosyltransferase, partial [Chloroflexaceae bacterium]|nr:glycosyltransferase [Chloroflexaceae bacterium]